MKNVKDIVMVGLKLSMALDQAKADGKVDISDVGFLIPVGMAIPEAVADAQLALAELKNATPEARAQFNVEIANEYNIADDKVEAIVECSLEVLVSIGKLLGTIEAAKKSA